MIARVDRNGSVQVRPARLEGPPNVKTDYATTSHDDGADAGDLILAVALSLPWIVGTIVILGFVFTSIWP